MFNQHPDHAYTSGYTVLLYYARMSDYKSNDDIHISIHNQIHKIYCIKTDQYLAHQSAPQLIRPQT